MRYTFPGCIVVACTLLIFSACNIKSPSGEDIKIAEMPSINKWLYIENSQVIDPRNQEALDLVGVNLAQWFHWEGYLWGLNPEPGYQRYDNLPQNELLKKVSTILPADYNFEMFWNDYQKSFITDWDFQYIKDLDLNVVRIPIHHYLFESEQGQLALKEAIDRCERFEIFCLLDVHTVPGAQSSYSPSDPINGAVDFWKNPDHQEKYFEYLTALSDIAGENFYVLGYDLLNEPEVEDLPMLRRFYKKAIAHLRNKGDFRITIVQTNKVSLNLEEIYLGDDVENVLYSVHYYGIEWDGLNDFKPVFDFAQKKNIPILVGEYGNWANDKYAEHYDKYLLYAYKFYGLHSVYWPYKDLIPSNAENNNNFGLFSGPKTATWREFFTSLDNDRPLRTDFPFEKFFEEIRSEKLAEKEFVVRLFDVFQQDTGSLGEHEKALLEEYSAEDTKQNKWRKRRTGTLEFWRDCEGKTFTECRKMKLGR